ncbi:LysR family transcriptional regulator [Spirochaeta cellobiosiphila]|uniref:LysR family transcriptional regulator n=1 Tax=Spirochaeta cellobiosiphila TaxID=504483 RepID=UPI000411F589|nr:LysR family transcriptional regulator [Spirochaeta cellobiosiphila]
MIERKIHFFIATAETGSFTAAARKFNLSQSAISQQIRLLEEELEVRLFERSHYRPKLTSAGEYYFNACRKLLDLEQEIHNTVRSYSANGRQRSLNIGITGSIETNDLPRIIERYKDKEDKVYLNVKRVSFAEGATELEAKNLDLTFGMPNDLVNIPEIQIEALKPLDLCLICSQKHRFSKLSSVNIKDLKGEPVIAFSENIGIGFYKDFLMGFQKEGIYPQITKHCDYLEEMVMSVKLNQGVAFLSRQVISAEEDVCILDIENPHFVSEFCLGYLKSNDKEYLKPFLEEVIHYYRN